MLGPLIESLEFIDWFRAAFAGWRYLVSPPYRRETHARWKGESKLRILWNVICGVAGIWFTLLLVYFITSLFAGWDWLQRL